MGESTLYVCWGRAETTALQQYLFCMQKVLPQLEERTPLCWGLWRDDYQTEVVAVGLLASMACVCIRQLYNFDMVGIHLLAECAPSPLSLVLKEKPPNERQLLLFSAPWPGVLF